MSQNTDSAVFEPSLVTPPVVAENLKPIGETERIDVLDVLRGFALVGILLMNIEWFNRAIAVLSSPDMSLRDLDHGAAFLIKVFVEGKFYKLFSLLFGMGFAVMLMRAEQAERPFVAWFARRAGVLLLIGLAHSVFLWTGDILHDYAIGAFLLLAIIWLRRGGEASMKWPALLILVPAAIHGLVARDPMVLIGYGVLLLLTWFALYQRKRDRWRFFRNPRWLLRISIGMLMFPLLMMSIVTIVQGLSKDPQDLRELFDKSEAKRIELAAAWPKREAEVLADAAKVAPGEVGEQPDLDGDSDDEEGDKSEQKSAAGDETAKSDLPAVASTSVADVADDLNSAVAAAVADHATDGQDQSHTPAEASVAATSDQPGEATQSADSAVTVSSNQDADGKGDKKDKPEPLSSERWFKVKEYIARGVVWENQAMTHSSYWVATRYRFTQTLEGMAGAPFFAFFLLLPIFILGWWLVETGKISNAEQHLGMWRAVAMVSWPFGLMLAATGSSMLYHPALIEARAPNGLHQSLSFGGQFLLCAAYVSSFVLLLRKRWFQRITAMFAPLGRMALTNYLTHSLVFSTLFYGYGFNWFGHVPRFQQVGLVFAMIAAQIVVSHLWLQRFNYGPMEWLWRSATYLKWQTLRKA